MTPEESPLGQHAKARTADVSRRLKRAQSEIEKEIAKANGIYPRNSGRLSEAEVCRRAQVSPVTLLHPRHAETRAQLKKWLAGLKSTVVSGRSAVRSTVTQRVDEWEARYNAVATSLHVSRLELASVEARLAAAMVRTAELECALAEAQAQAGENVVPFPLPGTTLPA